MGEHTGLKILGIIGFIVLCIICRGGGFILAICGVFLLLVCTVGKKLYEENMKKVEEERRKFEEYWSKRWNEYYEYQKDRTGKKFLAPPPYVVDGKMTQPEDFRDNVWK